MLNDLEKVHAAWVLLGGLVGATFAGAVGGIALEYDQRAAELIFTRPRRRRRLLWTNWASGLLAVEWVALTPVLAWLLFCFVATGRPYGAGIFRTLVATLPVNMLIFGIALLSGVLLRKGPLGCLLAFALSIGYYVGQVTMYHYYGLGTPSWWFDKLYAGFPHSDAPIPWMIVLLWSAVALIVPFAAQKILEYRDVV